MAEARRLDEKEGERSRDVRGVRSRNQATDQPERTKQESLLYSLSSLRAVIKRTRSNSQCDHNRSRRRPEITVVSAEPLVRNSWFPGSSVVLPPLSQSNWSSTPVSQPPPSYDQVIQEKTKEEHISKPTAAPRRINSTNTSATQTDPEGGHSTTSASKCSAATPSSAERRSTGKKPQKPPRPLLPKQGDGQPVTKTVRPPERAAEKTPSSNTEHKSGCTGTLEKPSQAPLTNHCDTAVLHLPASSLSHQYPVPLPRKKLPNQSTAEQLVVGSLVRLGENSDSVDIAPEDESSNKYLKELLEIFCIENKFVANSDIVNQSDLATESKNAEMSTNNQGNMQARIQAFENQANDGNAAEQVKPQPRPRKAAIKPPVAAKPSVALKPFTASVDDNSQNVSFTYASEDQMPAAKPLPPRRPGRMSIKEELETIHSKGPPNRSRPSVLTRASCVYEDEPSPQPPVPPMKPLKEPLRPNLNINNHNSTAVIDDPDPFNSCLSQFPAEPETNLYTNGGSLTRPTRRPTTIRVPSKTVSFSDNFQDSHPPPLPVQKPFGSMNSSLVQRQMSTPVLPSQEASPLGPEPLLPPRKPSMSRTLPPRPPSVKAGPGRPHAPSLQTTGRSVSVPVSHASHGQRPVLPPRPSPGHRLYNKYTLELPHGIAEQDYNSSSAGELSFKKNEVLLLVEKVNHNFYECQVGEIRGSVHKSYMKVITPLGSDMSPSQTSGSSSGSEQGQTMEVMFDFVPEGPGELSLKAGDIVTMVEPVDSEWYRGTCQGSTGFFPINYVKVLTDLPKGLPERKPKPSPSLSGPRCIARFDFQGEHSDELSFKEGDVIQLKEYIGQDWVRGQMGVLTGIFPLNFVEIIEDLPPAPSQPKPQPKAIALPGMVAAQSSNAEIPKPAQVSKSNVNWVVALYDYAGKSAEDLSFQQGDCILITEQLNAEWSRGRLNGREGMFPTSFVESTTGQSTNFGINEAATPVGGKARALYSFTSDCEEELSLQVGDIITNLESVDDEWFLGDLRGRRAMVPKNYVQVLE